MQIIRWGLEKKCRIWVVSPTFPQSKKFYNDIALPLVKAGLIKKTLQSQGDIMIEFINGSIVEFKSAAAKDSLRGSTLDYLVLDEAAFIDKQTLNEILLPMIITKPNAKVLMVTTPKGKNWVWEYFNKIGKQYFSLRFTSADNPMADKELIEEFRKTMPKEMFQQEFEAEFIDSAAVFQNVNELSILKPNESYKEAVWLGIDIGMLHDFTVITALNSAGEMIWFDRFTGIEAPALKQRISQAFKKFNVIKGLIELNNQGLPIFQDLKQELGSKITGFDTTNSSKGEIINNLIATFSKKEIKLINDEQLKRELGAFIFKFSKTGKVQFEAANGFNDDMVMSLAIAWHCHNKHKFSSVPFAI